MTATFPGCALPLARPFIGAPPLRVCSSFASFLSPRASAPFKNTRIVALMKIYLFLSTHFSADVDHRLAHGTCKKQTNGRTNTESRSRSHSLGNSRATFRTWRTTRAFTERDGERGTRDAPTVLADSAGEVGRSPRGNVRRDSGLGLGCSAGAHTRHGLRRRRTSEPLGGCLASAAGHGAAPGYYAPRPVPAPGHFRASHLGAVVVTKYLSHSAFPMTD